MQISSVFLLTEVINFDTIYTTLNTVYTQHIHKEELKRELRMASTHGTGAKNSGIYAGVGCIPYYGGRFN